jgi:hypothetical protein
MCADFTTALMAVVFEGLTAPYICIIDRLEDPQYAFSLVVSIVHTNQSIELKRTIYLNQQHVKCASTSTLTEMGRLYNGARVNMNQK